MGADSSKPVPLRVLELCISHPRVDVPTGRDGRPLRLFAKVGLLNEPRSADIKASWDKAVHVSLPDEATAMVIRLYAADVAAGEQRLLTEVCLPAYACAGGLAEIGVAANGYPISITVALMLNARANPSLPPEEIARQLQVARTGCKTETASLSLTIQEVEVKPQLGASGSIADFMSPRKEGSGSARIHTDSSNFLPEVHRRESITSNGTYTARGNHEQAEDLILALPQSRRQVIALELENAALKARRFGGFVEDGASAPTHVRQLQLIQQESELLQSEIDELRLRLHQYEDVLNFSPSKHGPAPPTSEILRAALQSELAHRKFRRKNLEQTFQEYTQRLELQLDAQTGKASIQMDLEATEMQSRLKAAMGKRDDLMQKWKRVREAAAGPPTNPEANKLFDALEELKGRRNALEQEIASRHEREQGTAQRQELESATMQLKEELDQLDLMREDDRVRGESEIRELRVERDAANDRVHDAQNELQRLSAQVEAMKNMQAPSRSGSASLLDAGNEESEANYMRLQYESLEQELDALTQTEEEQKQQIRDLERVQEELVTKTGMATSQVLQVEDETQSPRAYEEALEIKADDLAARLSDVANRVQDQSLQVESVVRQTEATRVQSEALKAQYEATQRSLDSSLYQNMGSSSNSRQMWESAPSPVGTCAYMGTQALTFAELQARKSADY